jgi:hypothetical protein
MKDLMIDIETLGTRPGSVVTSIGAAFFDPHFAYPEYAIGPKMQVNIDITSSMEWGLHTEGDTLKWWLMQSTEAQMGMISDTLPVRTAYEDFRGWVNQHKEKELTVWSHSTFDIPLLYAAFTLVDVKLPWHFRQTGDIRTLSYLTKGMALNSQGNITRTGTHHNALDDVLYQIEYVSEMLRALQS